MTASCWSGTAMSMSSRAVRGAWPRRGKASRTLRIDSFDIASVGPGQQPSPKAAERKVHDHAEQADDQDGEKDDVNPEPALRLQAEIAKAGIRGDQLSYDQIGPG